MGWDGMSDMNGGVRSAALFCSMDGVAGAAGLAAEPLLAVEVFFTITSFCGLHTHPTISLQYLQQEGLLGDGATARPIVWRNLTLTGVQQFASSLTGN